MNKKIKELAKQCFPFDGYGEVIATYGNAELEQFANLIIERCCFLCTYPDVDDEQSYYANLFAEQLKEYFGLEK